MVQWKWEYGTLVLISVLHLYKSECPADIKAHTDNCLKSYYTQKQILNTLPEKLYMGIDTEYIRTLCNALQKGVDCLQSLEKQCPEYERAQIENRISSQRSWAELCTYPSIYEKYTVHLKCFGKTRAASENCFQNYRIQMTPQMIRQLELSDRRSYHQLCRHYDTFISCLKRLVGVECGDEAASLVELLTRPQTEASDHCRNDTLLTTTEKPTVKPARHDAVAYDVTNGAMSHIGIWSLVFFSVLWFHIMHLSSNIWKFTSQW